MIKDLATLSLIVILFISITSARKDYREYNLAAFAAQNRARTDPSHYADLARDQLENKFMYDSSGKPNKFICLAKDFKPKSNKCFDRLMTQEGSKVWEETIKELTTKTYNLGELQWSEGLAQACFDHILDQGPKGAEGHKGSDGSSPFARINRYTTNFGSGENLAYLDFDDAEDAVLDLLIDDGVPDRGHRKNILDSHFTHGGVSCGCHKGFTEMCCFAYGIAVKEKDPSRIADTAPQLKECTPYTGMTEGTTDQNYHLGSSSSMSPRPEKSTSKKQTENQIKPRENNSRKQDTNRNRRSDDDLYPGINRGNNNQH